MTNLVLLLLCEDEPLARIAIAETLEEAGFEVLQVGTGTEALKQLRADGARFAGIVTDIRLGKGPLGWEVAHVARELAPTVAVIYMSGDSAADWSAQGVPNSLMLAKPFAMVQLTTAVATLLNQIQPPPANAT